MSRNCANDIYDPDLAPCPFCGRAAFISASNVEDKWHIHTAALSYRPQCECGASTSPSRDYEAAKAGWNTRKS